MLEEVERPEPGPGEVLIKVHAAALNFADLLMIAGKYQARPLLPFSPGFEVAGTIARVGDGVQHLRPGQRVMTQTASGGVLACGGFAEYAVAPASAAQVVPDTMSDDEAAVFTAAYQTSYAGLVLRANLQPGETVLVHSAAGSVGLAAVQIARALGAGQIIGTVGSSDKCAFVRAQGADLALNYQTEDFVEAVKHETDGRGADIIYDPVGGAVGERSTKCVAFAGRILIIGFTSGQFPTFVGNHVLIKNYSVVGLHWGIYHQHDPAKVEQVRQGLATLYEAGQLKPVVGGRYPMARVAEAMEFLASRQVIGKIVLHW